MASSTDIVERKRARPSTLHSISYYTAESDFFSFHSIQMPKMSYFTFEPFNYTSLNHGCSQGCEAVHLQTASASTPIASATSASASKKVHRNFAGKIRPVRW